MDSIPEPAKAASKGQRQDKTGKGRRESPPSEAPDERGQGAVAFSKITVSDNLPKADAEKVVRGKLGVFRECYQGELAKNPKLRGRMIMALTVSPIGTVALADVQKSTFGGGDAEICVAKAARDFRFPKPSGGDGTVNVTIEFK